ncbi:hypothetical protein D3C72_1264050 [compost metagenome]
MLLAEIQSVGTSIDHRHFATIENGENRNGHADRAGTDDQNLLPPLDCATAHRMRTNSQKFGHRRLVEA